MPRRSALQGVSRPDIDLMVIKGIFAARWMVLGAIMLLQPAGRAMAADVCAAPAELTANVSPLPQVAAVLKPGGTLSVLTVGSATVFSPMESLQPGTVTGRALGLGSGARVGAPPSPSEAAFPLQMAQDLRDAFPGLNVSVLVKGGRGMAATEMLAIIKTELAAHHYDLVIWQTGTVEAVRNMPAGEYYQTLSDGSAAISDAGANLILVDPQFSRFLRANADLEPYARAMEQIAALPGTMLFRRYELMQYWANESQIDLEHTPKGQRVKAVEALHSCLGASLAHMITAAAHTAS